MNLELKCTPGIYVVGFMASGKSTVGRLLAQRLGWSFVDIDDEIEAAEGTAIAEIFETCGEAEFRRIETAIIHRHVHRIGQGKPAVVALGGGAFAEPANRALLENNGVTVWLDCPFELVERRVALASHRPLARDPRQFAVLYHARREAYALAHVRVPIESDDPAGVVEAILTHPLIL